MNCPICQKDLPIEEFKPNPNCPTLKRMDCSCKARINIKENQQLESYGIRLKCNGNIYLLIFRFNEHNEPEFTINCMTKNTEEVVRCDYLPQFTPDNALQKLKTYLIFS